jgi:hypothetical protein
MIPTRTKLMSRPNGCKVPEAYLYRARNLVERFFSRIKYCRPVATRYDKLAANDLALIQLSSIRLQLPVSECRPQSTRRQSADTGGFAAARHDSLGVPELFQYLARFRPGSRT